MIEFQSVGKTFRDGTAAVVDLSLTVPSDQITVIVGPSGCGKTTTLRMVNRMIEPTSGQIVWDGSPLKSKRKTALRRQMGYVIQSGGLFPHRTVLENIGTVPGLLGWSKDKTRKRALELLGSVGLDRKLADRYPAQLSGGQQQRVGVARALAADPLVLLMDEPFSAVDPVVRSELHEFFLGLQREISKTIILITHDIDEAVKLGDQVAILRVGGKLAQVGTPRQLLDEPADSFVEGFVGRDRGFRSLSFLPATGLQLDRVKVVRDPATAGEGPALVVDENARPVGWADPAKPGQVLALGSTFNPAADTLRTALDSSLTSPFGLAVAVEPDTGRYAGVIAARDILDIIRESRATAASERESVALASSSPEQSTSPEVDESMVDTAVVPAARSDAKTNTGEATPAPSARPQQSEPESGPPPAAHGATAVAKEDGPHPAPAPDAVTNPSHRGPGTDEPPSSDGQTGPDARQSVAGEAADETLIVERAPIVESPEPQPDETRVR